MALVREKMTTFCHNGKKEWQQNMKDKQMKETWKHDEYCLSLDSYSVTLEEKEKATNQPPR